MSFPLGKPHTKAAKEKIRKSALSFWRKPSSRKRMSQIKKQQYKSNPELRKKIDRAITEWHRDNPKAKEDISRKKISEGMKKFFINNPKAFEEFLKHGKNPLKPHLKTPQGFLVRSKGEKAIANFLYNHNINCQYESISLPITTKPFAGNICTPDFYIPEWNIFIEFYGGYPNAWKKKVLKNKIYKSHKIPVLAITPAELEDLDYYLLKQGKQLSESKIAREFTVRKWVK